MNRPTLLHSGHLFISLLSTKVSVKLRLSSPFMCGAATCLTLSIFKCHHILLNRKMAAAVFYENLCIARQFGVEFVIPFFLDNLGVPNSNLPDNIKSILYPSPSNYKKMAVTDD